MGYFPNMTAWEFWATDNCFKCAHWSTDEDSTACPVEMAHVLYAYELCNEKDHPGKVMLDMLIPPTKDGLGNKKCAMFRDRDGLSAKHLNDWQKYKALMAARDSDGVRSTETACPAPAPNSAAKRGGEANRQGDRP